MIEHISRADAKAKSLAHYFDGVPCKAGHTARKNTRSNNCLECDRLRRQRYYEQNRDKVLKSQRKCDLKRLYGLSLEDHQALLDGQNGACALCFVMFTAEPHVDHCHKTGKVRGLLCSNCNTALGLMQDSPELMLRAAAYVSRA